MKRDFYVHGKISIDIHINKKIKAPIELTIDEIVQNFIDQLSFEVGYEMVVSEYVLRISDIN
jgi:hypothetical protein